MAESGSPSGNNTELSGSNTESCGTSTEQEEFARKILLQRLTDRPRSRSELAEWLTRKNVSQDISNKLLDRFEELGLIDDVAFASMWVESRQRTKGLARKALDRELRHKGIADHIIHQTLDDIDTADEKAAACRLVQKKLRSMSGLNDEVKTRRLVGMLGRKGYSAGLAYAVVRDELSQPGQ